MEFWAASAGNNWIDLVQSLGIIASLLLGAWSVVRDHRFRLVENRLKITEHHRELWAQMAGNPKLKRILQNQVDLKNQPVTVEEERFVVQAILHLNVHFYAAEQRLIPRPEGLEADVASFFSLPIARTVWKKTRHLRDRKFARFVDGVLEARGNKRAIR